MAARFWEWHPYQRPFRQPLQTSHGEWRDRSGILLKFTTETGQVSYGEIAPLPWFGSETWDAACAWCRSLPAQLTEDHIRAIPDHLPACQFGFESAWLGLATSPPAPASVAALLPTGEAALTAWEPLWQAGYRTFKWKIAVTDIAQELQWLAVLRQALPPTARLRLDANGGLTETEAAQWLAVCDRAGVEYLEQPLPPAQLEPMMKLQADFATAIALDESVATLADLRDCVERGWTGVVVIKPAIAGFPSVLQQICQQATLDLVFSSVFETAIGRWAGLHLAAVLGNRDRAMGYGTAHWFTHNPSTPEAVWQHR